MLEPDLSLALSIFDNKGAYAVLIGSGGSRSAGIPTGWEVTQDLIRKLAILKGEDAGLDPAGWFLKTYAREPSYDFLLEQLGTPAERRQLLKRYFEPTEEERAQRLKTPTAGHQALAALVRRGYVRVILTTNFDRLIERALEDVGVHATVLSTSDALHGAMPIAHSECTVIKLHGDYLDTRIRNTAAELSIYDPAVDRVLDRIFDEYGLLILGWSADWDVALRRAIERCQSHRFTTFWMARGPLSGHADGLAKLRRAQVVKIADADACLTKLDERITALEAISRPHPLSARIAVETLKRYLVDPGQRIRLHDLISTETDRVIADLSHDRFAVLGERPTEALVRQRVDSYVAATETLRELLIHGCYWGGAEHIELWKHSVSRVARHRGQQSGLVVWVNSRWFPTLVLLYAGGIACVAARNWSTLAALLLTPILDDGTASPLALLHPQQVLPKEIANLLTDNHQHYTPLNDQLNELLREPLRPYLSDDLDYQRAFDRFEYILWLVHAHEKELLQKRIWGPSGRFVWRRDESLPAGQFRLTDEEERALVSAGLFGGDIERLRAIRGAGDDFFSRVRHEWGAF